MWIDKGKDYFENKMGDYLLTIEKIDTKKFEWSFFKKGYKIAGTSFDGIKHSTKLSAKDAAEDAYINYKNSK